MLLHRSKQLLFTLLFSLFINKVAAAQGDQIITISKDTMNGEIISSHTNKHPTEVLFKQTGFNDFVTFNSSEVVSFISKGFTYYSKIVPAAYYPYGKVFIKQEVYGCYKAYSLTVDDSTFYFLQKADFTLNGISPINIKKDAYKFFMERFDIATGFRTGNLRIEDILSATSEMNRWQEENLYDCNFDRSTGFIKKWELLNLSYDLNNSYNYIISNAYQRVFNGIGMNVNQGLKVDFLNHNLFASVNRDIICAYSTDFIETKHCLTIKSTFLEIGVNRLINYNPNKRSFLAIGYGIGNMKYEVIDNEGGWLKKRFQISSGNGHRAGIRIGRQFNKFLLSLSYQYHWFKNTTNETTHSFVQSKGINPLLESKLEFHQFQIAIGIRLSSVPLFRQYKQIQQ